MDLSVAQSTLPVEEDDQWDSEGFVIPSLELGDNAVDSEVQNKTEENIYLGPHGAPPSQTKQQQEGNLSNRKQRFRQKLAEADQRMTGSGSGRENKLANLQELVGNAGRAANLNVPKGSSRDWLDPHCHESQFEKRHR
ncbi:PREDICTED: uncharacterized protein LOC104811656 isoform X2 [Tarenaya hassleriana]|uniref:uncharacterized protein LOC104811656 isoform X2 n=1 Tax=Tarenaya hassleriana TaxID=28532 RepID=UPI00053C4F66|nr:PREDICTED: uncharacterized protein LOC104811656 isoform X2 [Tarenaya hassleriana]